MNIDVEGITAQRDKPLTRADVVRFLDEAGSSNKLNLSGRNMTGIDLAKFRLIETDLSDAKLSGANLSDTNLSGAYLSGAIMSEFERKQLRNRGVIGLDNVYVETTSPTSTLHIRIIEEPLTPYNLTTIISALTELSTKFWLIANGRLRPSSNRQSLKIRHKHKRSSLPSRKQSRSSRWLHLNARNRRLR